MHLRSDSFKPYHWFDPRLAFGKPDPDTHVTFAGNRNPHLAWSGVPEGTRSFALLCWDPDVPTVGDDVNQEGRTVPLDLPRTDFFHWVVCDLPASLREIAEGAHADGVTVGGKDPGPTPDGGLQGLNDYTGWFAGDPDMGGEYAGYDGMGPPWNDERIHGYRFAVYALDVDSLGLSGAFTGAELRAATAGHVLDSAEILGLYSNNPQVLAERGR
ncbi:MAG: YbhB/YbcL family Raf kinase inhibitor-like protein [Deltaproteobacteria bacterium]|nr:MAG: YbhB/YbcL family Raf kinase inhibitor-like protein [Deltaproteobacteria bacterium]